MKKIAIAILAVLTFHCSAQQKANTNFRNDSRDSVIKIMDENARQLMEGSGANSVSMGIVRNNKIYTKHYGELDKGKGNRATNETLFEIASVTKVFTGTLIANAVVEGKIKLSDDIRKYLTGSYPNLEYKGIPITVRDLQSYKTGIFRDFPDVNKYITEQNDNVPFKVKNLEDKYSKKQFFEDLASVKMDTLPGAIYKHTKLGPELSAVILENVYGKTYQQLLKEKIFNKIGMNATKLYLEKNDVLANGYNAKGMLMPQISDNLWGAAGLLKSNLGDLIKFMQYQLDTTGSVVAESHRQIAQGNDGVYGYSWMIQENADTVKSYWELGGAFGTLNILKVYPKYNLGISIIVNQVSENAGNGLFDATMRLEDDLKPFGRRSIGRVIGKKLNEGADKVIAYYYELKKTHANDYNFADENELNNMGGYYMSKKDFDSALKIFDINVKAFPNSGNVYDSRAYAYFEKKEYQLAANDFKTSLLHDQNNDGARDMLKKITALITK